MTERLNKQEVFDKVASHLLTQNARSVGIEYDEGVAGETTAYTKCMYRGKNNMMCAAGCLIPDDVYNRTGMENMNWGAVSHAFFNELDKVIDVKGTQHLVENLQDMHDIFEDPKEWPERLLGIAQRHGLEYKGTEFYRGEK